MDRAGLLGGALDVLVLAQRGAQDDQLLDRGFGIERILFLAVRQIQKEIMNPEVLKDIKIVIIGAGSGGSAVAMHCARNGFQNIVLVDYDTLERRNLYAHQCKEDALGVKKVFAVKSEILKVNPLCNVIPVEEDVFEGHIWKNEIKSAKGRVILVIATDNDPSRNMLNDFCVQNKIPFVAGKVFNKGIGGEVFRFIPGKSGCLSCLEICLNREGTRAIDDLNNEEKQQIYQMGIDELKKTPGLAIDIAFIPLIHARMILDTALQMLEVKSLPYITSDYIIWNNHAIKPLKASLYPEKFLQAPVPTCNVCRGGDCEV